MDVHEAEEAWASPVDRRRETPDGRSPRTPRAGRERAEGGRRLTPEARAKREERQRRQAEQRQRRRRVLAVAVAAVVVVLVAGIAIYRSPLLTIETIEVEGVDHLTEPDVLAYAAVATGTTLPSVDADAIEDRLEQDPWVASAEVKRRLPSTLRIVVQERVPVALVDDGAVYWSVDGTSLILGESVPETGAALPIIQGVPGLGATPGAVSDVDSLGNALAAIAGMPDDMRAIVVSLSAPSVDETTLITDTGVEIRIGNAGEDLAKKCAVALSILAEKGDAVVYIDVRSADKPISRGL